MLSCAQRLARTRAPGLIWAQSNNTPGAWHRSLRTSRIANTVHASTSAPLHHNSDLQNQHFASSQAQTDPYINSPQQSVPHKDREVQSPTTKNVNTTTNQRESVTQNKTNGRPRKGTYRSITKTTVRKIIHAQGVPPKLAHRVTRRLNDALRERKKGLNDRSLYLAAVIGSNSLYSRDLGLQQWRYAFKELYLAKRHGREIENKSALPVLSDTGKELLEKVRNDCHGSFRETWNAMRRAEKASHWQHLAIWLLQNDPRSLPNFLIVTTECQEKPNFTIVYDCLRYLDNFYYSEFLKDWESNNYTYQTLIEACLNPRDWPIVSLTQRAPRLFIRRAGHDAVAAALRIARERDTQISAETALCFMWRFTEFEDVDRALQALEYVSKDRTSTLKLDSEEVLRHCCKLLTLDTVQNEGASGRNFRILPRLLKMGIRPGRDMMNVVLSNAFKTGDPQLGNDILEFMKNHDQTFDSYTYLTLLKDAVSRGDRARVDSLIHEIDTKEELRNNPYLASKIFHSHYVFTTKYMDADADPSGVFYSMLDMYNQLHDITPLKELLIIPPHYTPQEGSNLPPSPVALYIMIATFFRCQNRLSNVQRIYTQFRHLVAQGHPLIAPLAKTDHTYNEFLIAIRDNPRGLRFCVRLVEDMLQSSAKQNGKTPDHTKPSMRTWTILLSAFTFNRQPRAAEKIKQMMSKHKVKYNAATWNIIINGYANAQDIPQTATAIKAMEEEGFTIDPYTMRCLRYLRDPERLWVAIDELDDAATMGHSHRPTNVEQTEKLEENADSKLSIEEQREKELDEGLGKLGGKLKPKL